MKAVRIIAGVTMYVVLAGMCAAESAEHLYSEKCATCHAPDGSGHTAAAAKMAVPDLRSKRIKEMSDEEIYAATAQGKGHKSYPHAFLHTGLTEKQIQNLVKYVRTFSGNQNQLTSPVQVR